MEKRVGRPLSIPKLGWSAKDVHLEFGHLRVVDDVPTFVINAHETSHDPWIGRGLA